MSAKCTKGLIYGFGPYEHFKSNLTEIIVLELRKVLDVSTHIFPVVFAQEMFVDVFDEVRPDVIIGLGQHPRARKFRIERRARNWMIPGRQPPGHEISPGAMPQAFATLSLPRDHRTTISYDAGTYVCNYSMWQMHRWCQERGARWAFLHVPLSRDVCPVVDYLKQAVSEISPIERLGRRTF